MVISYFSLNVTQPICSDSKYVIVEKKLEPQPIVKVVPDSQGNENSNMKTFKRSRTQKRPQIGTDMHLTVNSYGHNLDLPTSLSPKMSIISMDSKEMLSESEAKGSFCDYL